MSEFVNFWNLILESNTFNFIILLILVIAVMQKLNIGVAIEKIKNDIVETIEKSKQAKANAYNNYSDAKTKIEHIEEEISGKLNLASQQAENVAASIAGNIEKKIKQIEANAVKVIAAEEKTLVTTLTDSTSKSSVNLAETYVRSRLTEEPDLHKRYIEESIFELDKVKI